MSETTALDWLLAEKVHGRDPDSTPWECCYCPFASQTPQQEESTNWMDPGEGHYNCALLDKSDVWGEGPVCSPDDWRARARTERAELSPTTPS